VLVSVHDRCMFAPYVPLAKKLFGMQRMVHLGDKAPMEARFGPFRAVLVSVQDRCTVCSKCTIASEIVLDAQNGTPM
jgi:hypothetical protein